MAAITQPTNHDRSSTPSGNNASNPSASKIRILTLNVWGLKYISFQRTARLTHVAHLLTTSLTPPDIVCLQELFTYESYLTLRRLTHPILPHGKFYQSGIFGAGLVILSKWPIVETRMIGYGLNGRPSAFWRGDWYVGKGVACAKIALPAAFWEGGRERYLEVFNTHLHAPYNEGVKGKDTYSCHRVAQAWEIAGLMRRGLERGSLVVGCGDFNMVVGGLEWRVLRAQTHGQMRDVWREVFPESSVGAWIDGWEKERLRGLRGKEEGKGSEGPPPTVEQSLGEHGHTCDSVLNTWRWSKNAQKDLLKKGRDRVVRLEEEDPKAKRLDYIFLGDENGEWVVNSARVCMTERHPELKCSLSDHFAVEAEIVRRAPPNGTTITQNGKDTPRPRHAQPEPAEIHALYTRVLSLLASYTSRSRLHRRRRLTHFLTSVFVTFACFVAIWFSPTSYVSFILVLLSSLGLMAGTLDGLIGGLFGGKELRGLKEWEGEVRRAIRLEIGGEEGITDEWNEQEEEAGRVRDWWD